MLNVASPTNKNLKNNINFTVLILAAKKFVKLRPLKHDYETKCSSEIFLLLIFENNKIGRGELS